MTCLNLLYHRGSPRFPSVRVTVTESRGFGGKNGRALLPRPEIFTKRKWSIVLHFGIVTSHGLPDISSFGPERGTKTKLSEWSEGFLSKRDKESGCTKEVTAQGRLESREVVNRWRVTGHELSPSPSCRSSGSDASGYGVGSPSDKPWGEESGYVSFRGLLDQ